MTVKIHKASMLSIVTTSLLLVALVSLTKWPGSTSDRRQLLERTDCAAQTVIGQAHETGQVNRTDVDRATHRIEQYAESAVWKPWLKPTRSGAPLDRIEDQNQGYSSITVISPGLCHFSNVYHFNGTVIFVVRDPEHFISTAGWQVDPAHCLGPRASFSVVNRARFTAEHPSVDERWQGTTLATFETMFEDIETHNWIKHYYHFMEYAAPLWTLKSIADSLNLTTGPAARAVYFDRELEMVRGLYTAEGEFMHLQVLSAFFGLDKDSIFAMDDLARMWNDYGQSATIMIESALVMSRGAIHSYSGVADVLGKIGMSLVHLVTPESIAAMKATVLQNLGLKAKGLDEPSRVTYIDRQSTLNRKLSNSAHEQLVTRLAELKSEGWDVQTPKMELLSWSQQVEVMSKTDVLLGVHGNGLTNLLYLPMGAGVIEIFPEDQKAWDYEWLSSMSGVKYLGVDRQGVIWDKRLPAPGEGLNSDSIEISPDLITRIVRRWRMSREVGVGLDRVPVPTAGSWMSFDGIGTWVQF